MIRKAFPALAIAALPLATTPAYGAEVQIASSGPVIELSIHETVDVEPDIATIGAGVTTDAPTAVEAMRQNSAEMQRVIERIKALGVDPKDIQTSGINLNARYDYNRTTQRQVFRGYQVSNRVSVKLREIDEVGEVLDALVASGATNLSGPNFSIDDDTQAKEAARKRAMKRAKDRAMSYARMAGYSDIRLLEISESIMAHRPMPIMRRAMADAEVSQVASAPVEPGLVQSGVSISVKYEMR